MRYRPLKTLQPELSQIEIEETGFAGIFTVTLPEWLALEKGLI